jgi:hypothetical protein
LAVFSDRFSEGTLKNLRDGFPSDEEPHTDSYDYLSDSDLDEEEGDSEIDDPPNDAATMNNPAREKGVAVPDQEWAQTRTISSSAIGRNDAEPATVTAEGSRVRPGTPHVQPGKVAIIRDMAATT